MPADLRRYRQHPGPQASSGEDLEWVFQKTVDRDGTEAGRLS
jgi:hypothetical protein